MSSKAITIYTPPESLPHISAQDDAFIYDSILGGRSGILGGLVCQWIDNNTVRLYGGGVSNKGYILWVPTGEYCDLTVTNCSPATNRHDIVAAEFIKGDGNTPDRHEFIIIPGEESDTPFDPPITASELINSGDVNQLSLFRLVHRGLEISAIQPTADNVSPAISCSGNAETASRLGLPFSLSLSGEATGAVQLDGSENVTLNVHVKSVDGHKIFVQQSEPTNAAVGDLWIW